MQGMERISKPHTYEMPEVATWDRSRIESVLAIENVRMTIYALLEVGKKGRSDNGEITCPPGGDSMNIQYTGDFAGEMARGEVVYVRFKTWYRSEQMHDTVFYAPWEVRLVAKSFGDWLRRWGVAMVITESEAAEENDFQRRYVRGKWREEAIDLDAEKRFAVAELCAERLWRAVPVLNAIKERGCEGLDPLMDAEDWSAVVDLLVDGKASDEEAPGPVCPLIQTNGAMGKFNFTMPSARTCIGGPNNGAIHDNRFVSFHPHDYEDTDIFTPEGDLFMLVWTHKSLDTPEKRCAAFGDWYSEICKSLPQEEAA